MKRVGKNDTRRLASKETTKLLSGADPFALEGIKTLEKLTKVLEDAGRREVDAGQPNHESDAGHRPFEGKYSELVPEIILRVLERCVVQPFGCEFTFIPACNLKNTRFPEFSSSHRFHDDDGALEHSSKVFESIEECFDFWLELCAELKPLGYLPQRGTRPNGGLHINVDFPSQSKKEKAKHVKELLRIYDCYERPIRLMNEPGDYHNAQFFGLTHSQLAEISDANWLKFLSKAPCKTRCIAYHDKYLEFRHFNSPATLAELAIYVLHAQSMMQPVGPQSLFSSWVGLRQQRHDGEQEALMDAFNVVLNEQLGWHYAEDRAARDYLDYEVIKSMYKFC